MSPDPATKAIIVPPVAPRSRLNDINIRSQKAVNDEVEESQYVHHLQVMIMSLISTRSRMKNRKKDYYEQEESSTLDP